VPCLLVLALDRPGLEYPQTLTFNADGSLSILKLRGVIYGGDHDFTSRYIIGGVWFHDGITKGRSCVFEGDLNDLPNSHLTSARGKSAINPIYAQV
ncbi:hypothetical protein C8F04DRAFT_915676, partial [Mycena alexandri]